MTKIVTYHGFEVAVGEEDVKHELGGFEYVIRKATCPVCSEEITDKATTHPCAVNLPPFNDDSISRHIQQCTMRG